MDDAFGVEPPIWEGIPKALSQFNNHSELSKIRHPVLIVHGTEDPILSIGDSIEMSTALPKGIFMANEGHGHSLNVEDARKFVNLANQFFFRKCSLMGSHSRPPVP